MKQSDQSTGRFKPGFIRKHEQQEPVDLTEQLEKSVIEMLSVRGREREGPSYDAPSYEAHPLEGPTHDSE